LVTDDSKGLLDGAVGGKLGRYLTKGKGYYEMLLRTVARQHRIDLERPVRKLTPRQRALLFHGAGAREQYRVTVEKATRNTEVTERFTASWQGLCGHVDAWHAKTDDPGWATILETVMSRRVCQTCSGERLASGPRAVTVGRKRLPELLSWTVTDTLAWIERLRLRSALREAVEPVLAELRSRLGLLQKVGLGYLTLDRPTATLSGGEARRVRLSASLGSELTGVCYVLDEPTVGLHPSDVERLIGALEGLKERGNTVVVVEHDAQMMMRADWLIDMGPGAGIHGGHVVAAGTPREVAAHPTSGTAAYLRGEVHLDAGAPESSDDPAHSNGREPESEGALPGPLLLTGASLHNLCGTELEVAFGVITGICGPSGSGKSTLVLDTLVPALRGEAADGRWESIHLPEDGVRAVVVDASPIGRSPHSVPATYTGLSKHLRELFARTPDARQRGFTPSHFSFNSTKGRCPACEGRGAELVEMQFLADLWLTCEECDGKRFQPEILEVRFRGRSIADVMAMTVEEALEFLVHQPQAVAILRTLADIGLGYLGLGQSSTTLSGGEAQRVKLATELRRTESGMPTVLVLDEPSTGLSATDIVPLAHTLRRLARRGDAVVLIEHHTELLGICDHLIELGPGGGDAGGQVIARGTPAELASNPDSVTGPWLGRGPALSAARNATRRKRKNRTPVRQENH